MKIAKILSAASAAVVAAAAVASTASATLTVVDAPDAGLSTGTGMWLVQVFNTGNEAENKPATDYGVKLDDIASISITVTVVDPDFFDGSIGGNIVTSCGPASATPADHNWPQAHNEFWGVIDPAIELDTQSEAGKPVNLVKTGDYQYTAQIVLDDTNCIYDVSGVEGGYVQIGIQEWGSVLADFTVIDASCYDAAGNVLLTFDGNGVVDDVAIPAVAVDDGAADATTPDDTATDATTTPDKGSPDTGVEGVAAVAGVAIVAAGAVVLSKKRK